MVTPSPQVRPVVLSGGGGTRLWPLSRDDRPKQFQSLFGDHSLLQATVARCRSSLFYPPLIVAAESHGQLVLDQLAAVGVNAAAVILEPEPRNTAPAIAAVACWAMARNEDDPLLVMPSDHLIEDVSALTEAVRTALPSALEGKLVTFGIMPTGPNTGYGYIAAGEGDPQVAGVRIADRFIEKPAKPVAEQLLSDGHSFWNSGIFLFRPSAILRELAVHAPEVAEQVEQAMRESTTDGRFVKPAGEAFAAAPGISIDYAVMERSSEVRLVPVTLAWSDVGSWDAVHRNLPHDAHGNAVSGDVLALDVRNSLIRNDGEITVAAIGLEGIVCVVTPDALLLAPMGRAQEVRRLAEALRAKDRPQSGQ